MQDLLSDHPLHLHILLPDPDSDSGLKKLHLLSQWSPWMQGLNIQPVFCCRSPEICRQAVQAYFSFPVSLEDVCTGPLAARLSRTVEKPVFGQTRSFIGTGLFLCDGSQVLYETRRINTPALQHLMKAALKGQTAWLRSCLAEPIDTFFCR